MTLGEREVEILILFSQGFGVKEISEKLCISQDTVKFHRKKMFDKMEVGSISEALGFATSNKII